MSIQGRKALDGGTLLLIPGLVNTGRLFEHQIATFQPLMNVLSQTIRGRSVEAWRAGTGRAPGVSPWRALHGRIHAWRSCDRRRNGRKSPSSSRPARSPTCRKPKNRGSPDRTCAIAVRWEEILDATFWPKGWPPNGSRRAAQNGACGARMLQEKAWPVTSVSKEPSWSEKICVTAAVLRDPYFEPVGKSTRSRRPRWLVRWRRYRVGLPDRHRGVRNQSARVGQIR